MGLIAHYRLDGDATDAVGGLDGQVNGGVQWVTGVLGGALDLTGGSKWVTGDGWPITGDFSYSFWAKQIEISASSIGGLVGNHWHTDGPTGVGVYFRSSLTQITIATADGVSRPTYHVDLVTPITERCHYAVTCRGGWVSVYQNGQHLDTRYQVIVQDQSRAWAIGRWAASYSSSYYYEGLIDDVRIYDHALSPREVRDLSLGLMIDLNPENMEGSVWEGVSSYAIPSSVDGKSIVLDGTNEVITETDLSGYLSSAVDFSISVDFQIDDAPNDTLGVLFGAASYGGLGIAWERSGSGQFVLRGYCRTTDIARTTMISIASGVRYRAFLVHDVDANSLTLKVGEAESSTSAAYGNHGALSSIGNIGVNKKQIWGGSTPTSRFTGRVYRARIYATALTPAQVKEIYQQRASIDSEGNLHVS